MFSFLLNLLLQLLLLPVVSSTRVRDLSYGWSYDRVDTTKLKAALRSGEPWVIGCLGLDKEQESNVNNMLSQLTNELDSNKKFKNLPDKLKVGTVDCKLKLPSGKSLKSKYKLNSQKGIPTFFFVANGRAPKQLKVTDFTKKDKKDKAKLMLDTKIMAKFATKAAIPYVQEIKTDVALKHNCLKHKNGSILLLLGKHGGRSKKISKSQTRVLRTMMREHRSLRICSVDLSKHEVRLPKSIAAKVIRDDSQMEDNGVEARPPQMLFLGWGPNRTALKLTEAAKNEDNSKDDTETPKIYGKFRHLNEDSKQWESKEKNSKVGMSLCRHLMHNLMDRNAARRTFEKHRVNLKHLTSSKKPESKFTHANALFRIQGRYYTWETAAPFLSTMALFDGSLSTDALSRLDAKSVHKEEKREAAAAKATKEKDKKKKPSNIHHVGVAPLRGGKFNANTLKKVMQDLPLILKDDEVMMELEQGTRPELKKYVSPAERARTKKQKERKKMKKLRQQRERKRKDAEKMKQALDEKKKIAEERKKDRAKKEQAKRAKMDKMAEKHFVQGIEEEEEDDEEDEDEEVLNLDEDTEEDDDNEDEEDVDAEEIVIEDDEEEDEDEEVIDLDDEDDEDDVENEDVVDLDDEDEEEEEREEL
jgi:hypothetical protein